MRNSHVLPEKLAGKTGNESRSKNTPLRAHINEGEGRKRMSTCFCRYLYLKVPEATMQQLQTNTRPGSLQLFMDGSILVRLPDYRSAHSMLLTWCNPQSSHSGGASSDGNGGCYSRIWFWTNMSLSLIYLLFLPSFFSVHPLRTFP